MNCFIISTPSPAKYDWSNEIKSCEIVGYVARVEDKGNVYRVMMRNAECDRLLIWTEV